jgi:spore coat protein CotH
MRTPATSAVGLLLVAMTGTTAGEALTYWVPVVAHTTGAQGSVWRSDIALLNLCPFPASVELRLHVSGAVHEATRRINSASQEVLEDVVALLAAGNLTGALEIVTDQELVIASRTYNVTSAGTLGQAFEAYRGSDGIDNGETAYLAQLQQTSVFRTNIGVLNMGSKTATVTIELFEGGGTSVGTFTLSVPGGEMRQDNAPYSARFHRTDLVGGFATVTVAAGKNVWAYASIVDNHTGDPTTVPMREFDSDCDFTQPLERFFDPQVHHIDIQVDDAGVQSLLDEPKSYVHGVAVVDSVSYADVGVRLKGGPGSFIPLDGDYPVVSGSGNGNPGKSAFIIDFERYQSGRCMLGLHKLTLNNMVQDDSGIHEVLGYALFRAGDVPASRAVYATVSFNGEEKGLYVAVESPDNDEFLENWFGNAKGNLYEGAYGSDLYQYQVERFDQDNGSDHSREDLLDLIAALDAISPGQEVTAALDEALDLDAYLAFAATEVYLGHWDGYARSANNYMIHHDLKDDIWTFVPWGIDQLFEDPMGPYSGVMNAPGPSWGPMGGRIQQLCYASSTCRARVAAALVAVLDRADAIDLAGLAATARQLVEPLMLAESTAHGDPQRTLDAFDRVASFIGRRRAEISTWLPCLIGGAVDTDGDGFDACTVDCDDRSSGIHPGATELCNLVDDNCNGVLDDDATCPRCLDEEGPSGQHFSLCFDRVSWIEARQRCLTAGSDLASIHDAETEMHLSGALVNRLHANQGWIGLNDRDTEGTFVWSDGSPLDFLFWSGDSPKPQGDPEDCVLMSSPGWSDVPCEVPAYFVCGPE